MSPPTAVHGITTGGCQSCSGARRWRRATAARRLKPSTSCRPWRRCSALVSTPPALTANACRPFRASLVLRANYLKTLGFFICRSGLRGQWNKWGAAAVCGSRRFEMRHLGIALALALSVPVAGCVQTRQFADLQFTPPQGDYRLLVMRPDVTVNSVTTGGMPEPRADWTEQARANIT